MSTQTKDWERVAQALETLQAEVARLGERVSALEGARGVGSSAPAAPPPAKPASASAVATQGSTETGPALEGEELALVIAAAVAAFLGKRAHVRQIRLIGSAAWSQQGRVTIQASHDISSHTGRSRP